MKKFVLEYGRLVITIIALLGFFVLLGGLLAQDSSSSIYGIFHKESQDSTAVYNKDFYDSVIGDTVDSSVAPYFKIADSADFGITNNQIDYNRLFRDISIIYKGQNITNKTSVDGKAVTKTVLVSECVPSIISATGDDINGHIDTEEVYALDKYGHYIYKDAKGRYNTDKNYDSKTGQKVKITQPKFLTSDSVVFKTNNYIDCSPLSEVDNARQYKVTYRVQVGELKAECVVKYIKNRAGTNIDVSGKTKIEFTYTSAHSEETD